jgi:hypothetical protein
MAGTAGPTALPHRFSSAVQDGNRIARQPLFRGLPGQPVGIVEVVGGFQRIFRAFINNGKTLAE